MLNREQKGVLIRIVLTAVLWGGLFFVPAEGMLRLGLYLLPYLLIGYDLLWKAAAGIVRGKLLDESFLMAAATIGAFFVSEYPEAVAVLLLYQVGELFQDVAVDQSMRSIEAMLEMKPETVCVLRNGQEVVCPPEEVSVGEVILIRPGERVPLDGVVTEGQSALDCSSLTGESAPRAVLPGESAVSGSINLSAPLWVRVSRLYPDSTVAKILELMDKAAARKAKAERFITRFARIYTPCVVGGAVLLAVLPPLLFSGDFSEWLRRALLFLVVSCPCALVISVPLAFFTGIGRAAKLGILIRGSSTLESLAKVETVAFDKTGTLTEGRFRVSKVHPAGRLSEDELLTLAASAEAYSDHPLAKAIRSEKPVAEPCGEVTEQPGLGVRAVVGGRDDNGGQDADGRVIFAGSRRWLEMNRIAVPETGSDGTAVFIADADGYLGRIGLRDAYKPTAVSAIRSLRGLGIKQLVLLTGDSRVAGEQAKDALGFDAVSAELLPAGKVEAVERLIAETSKRGTVAFVGDGMNDAPVLARADVGIAMGALGSDAAIGAADVVLMDDTPEKPADAISVARQTLRVARQNIVFALTVKLAVLVLGALGWVGMGAAVFADVGVTVLSVLNVRLPRSFKKGGSQ